MQALITGGAGFIGSHLSEKLLAQGHGVTVVDDLSTGSMNNIAGLLENPRFRFVRESVRNEIMMTTLVERAEVIYHLAAAVGVQLIVDRPVHTIETNIHGSEVVLSLANKFRTPVLIASTSEVYGKSDDVPFREDSDVVYGCTKFSRWAYACSKAIDEFLALAYFQENQLPVVIARFFNTVGPRQTGMYGMVVPRFVQRALAGQPLDIYGTGKQSRCFCNVSDVVSAVIKLTDCPQAVGQVINVGSSESITIEDLADLVVRMTGSRSQKQHLSYEQAYGRPFDDMLVRVPDLTKVHRLIGFTPKFTLEQTLSQIIEFEKAAKAIG